MFRKLSPVLAAPALAVLASAAAGVLAAPAAHADTPPAGQVQTPLTASLDVTDGETVGVGMPVSLTFDRPVTGAAAQRAVASHVTVASDSGQQASGHWFGTRRLDFRPRTYWKPGSTVTVRLSLAGVKAGDATGTQDQTLSFHVGRSRVSVVDAATHTMRVFDGNRQVGRYAITAGGPDTPTRDGIMVVSEKDPEVRMNASTVKLFDADGAPAYDIPDVPHALRLTASGTFLHGNYWARPGVFGVRNTSHGCIGLRDVKGGSDASTPAARFYSQALVGDVVEVRGTGGAQVAPDNGLGDWNLNWSAW